MGLIKLMGKITTGAVAGVTMVTVLPIASSTAVGAAVNAIPAGVANRIYKEINK